MDVGESCPEDLQSVVGLGEATREPVSGDPPPHSRAAGIDAPCAPRKLPQAPPRRRPTPTLNFTSSSSIPPLPLTTPNVAGLQRHRIVLRRLPTQPGAMASFSPEAHHRLSAAGAVVAQATPPAPPPKPGSHETSRMGTPSSGPPLPPPPPSSQQQQQQQQGQQGQMAGGGQQGYAAAAGGADDGLLADVPFPQSDVGPDPGDGWLPSMLQDKS